MRRRDLIAMLGAAAIIATSGAQGQTASNAPRHLVILSPDADPGIADFRARLRELGYVEGRDVALDIRSAEARFERLPAMADELTRDNPDAIVALTTTVATALHHATETIPIIAFIAVDPVAAGLAKSLGRPGGNITGIAFLAEELNAKRIELLHEIAPGARRIAAIAAQTSTEARSPGNLAALEKAGNKLGLSIETIVVDDPAKLRDVLGPTALAHFDGFIPLPDIIFSSRAPELVMLLSASGKPAVYSERRFIEGGGLISVGPNFRELFGHLAVQTDRVLKGTKPADIPFELPRTFELLVNLRAARASSIAMPESVVVRADEVIE